MLTDCTGDLRLKRTSSAFRRPKGSKVIEDRSTCRHKPRLMASTGRKFIAEGRPGKRNPREEQGFLVRGSGGRI
jgi:hypothetical protein